MILLWGGEGYSKDAVSWNYNGPRLHDYNNPVATEDYIMLFIVIGVIFCLYLFRHIPIIGMLWRIVSIGLVVLVTILTVNYAKKEIKEWWNKD